MGHAKTHSNATHLVTHGFKARFQARGYHSAPLRKSASSAAKDFSRLEDGMGEFTLLSKCTHGEKLDG